MSTIINCVGGHGDVMFCEPIFRWFWQRDVVKPQVIIHDHQMYFKDYIDSANFIPKSNHPEADNPTLHRTDNFRSIENINLRWANQIYRGYAPHDHHDFANVMLDKYRLLGLPEDLWKTLNINFDIRIPQCKGVDLAMKLNVLPTLKYALLNQNSQAGKANVAKPGLQVYKIHMEEIPGYNVIDWWYLIWSARENHHVSTSTFYLMQAIKNKLQEWNAPCYIYPRPNDDGLLGISQLKPDFNIIRVEKL